MNSVDNTIRQPVIEHLQELRMRLMWCVVVLIIGGGVGFWLHEKLMVLIQRPLGETLYYTSPTGGFNFAFKMSLTFGLVIATPVIVYQLLKFLAPLIGQARKLFMLAFLLWSFNLAYLGVLFAYFISLPAALKFLTNFSDANIQAIITADEYFGFALAYIGGFAILFQLPLLVLLINRARPLRPSKMMGAQRYVIAGSLIVAAILTPTPDPFNQLIMAVPIILLYQLSVTLVWLVNRKSYRSKSKPVVTSQVPVQPEAAFAAKHVLASSLVNDEPTADRRQIVSSRPVMRRSIDGIIG